MKRREFLGKSGCGMAGLMAAPMMFNPGSVAGQERRKRYKIEIEIYEAREDTWCHKKGDTFKYPDDWGKLCPWLRASMNEFIRILEHGVTLNWKYQGTPYEKVIDPGRRDDRVRPLPRPDCEFSGKNYPDADSLITHRNRQN